MAGGKTTFTVTLPDGRVAKRQSDRPYTHVVIGLKAKVNWGYDSKGNFVAKGFSKPTWEALTWTTKPQDALYREEKHADKMQALVKHPVFTQLQVVAVTVDHVRRSRHGDVW